MCNFYSLSLIGVFLLGYFFITIEHFTKINKTAVALIMAIICWALYFQNCQQQHDGGQAFLDHSIGDVSQVVYFLIGALVIVETINVHRGFEIILRLIRIQSSRQMLWLFGILTFFLSSILDNLTTTIVMLSILSKCMKKSEGRLLIGGALVIAANAGGAWTPIGDVTTTMLWIGGQVTPKIMIGLFLPSLACMLASFGLIHWMLKDSQPLQTSEVKSDNHLEPWGIFIFIFGIALLVFIPIFKMITGLPPFMGVFFGLSLLWLVTDVVHQDKPKREHLKIPSIIAKIDFSTSLFFLGILLCVSTLEASGILKHVAELLNRHVGNTDAIAFLIGLASAVVDNVPLVAATMGMYNLADFPVDSRLWDLIAYCAGTGGSILVIGSAAGVVYMALEKVDFVWYFKRIAGPAFLGYVTGIAVYMALNYY